MLPHARLIAPTHLLLLTALGISLPAMGAAPNARGPRVLLVGVDGASWNVIEPMVAAGELPHLSTLMRRGTAANLATVEPVSSPVVWTSIATGRTPDAHGVKDFYSTRLEVETPTSFERLAAAGHRVGLYDYLMTWPPVSLPGGFVIPGWLRRDETVTPRDVWARIPLAPHTNEYDRAKTSADYLDRARRDARDKAPRMIALARTFDLDVGATVLYPVDMTSHRFWHHVFPAADAQPAAGSIPGETTAVRDAYRGVDRSIGLIAESLTPQDVILVMSDHGFQDEEDGKRNVWVMHLEEQLAKSGLVPGRDAFSIISSFGAVTLRVAPGDIAERDALLDRLVAVLRSHRTEQGDTLFSVVESIDVAPRPPELQRPLLTRVRQWVVAKAVELVFGVEITDTAHAIAFALPADEVLSASWPAATVRVDGRTAAIQDVVSLQRFTGAHDPTAVFIAAGGPITATLARGELSVLDVAPLLFYLRGEAIPDDLEGRLPIEIIDPAHLRQNPPRSIPAVEAPDLPASARAGASVDDPALEEKLRALGYIE